jgi:hypothetical protein
MILFVFEGKKREPSFFKTMKLLFFPQKSDFIVCSYCNNIYSLYQKLTDSEGKDLFTQDLIAVLQQEFEKRTVNPLSNYHRDDFSEIYLFFDYDCQDKSYTRPINTLNEELEKMLHFFNDETDQGLLYINYPMIESIRYTKKLPDKDHHTYTIAISDCNKFKCLASEFSVTNDGYHNFDFLVFKRQTPTPDEREKVLINWTHLKEQHTKKACFICTNNLTIPEKQSIINQHKIFKSQMEKYIIPENKIAILNAFPLFLYDYFGK